MRALRAQLRAELLLASRQGEQLLVSLGIPLLVLVFFSTVDVLPTGTEDPVDFLAPGVLALAIMSTAMVSLGIGTGFERQYGVLQRLGATPLGRGRWTAAKVLVVLALEAIQVALLVPVALALGWSPDAVGVAGALVGVLLGTAAFAGIGLLLAGNLPGVATLAIANGLYLVLLLLGGMIVPLEELPAAIRAVSELLPAAALSTVLHATIGAGEADPTAWAVLAAWAIAAPVLAARTFRWDPAR